MKKSLSLIVASAMAFSAFASAAFADEKALDAQGKFDALKAAGIMNGYTDGSAGLDREMTRAEFAKVLALLEGLKDNATASNYSDVADNHWAKGYIGAVTEAGLMNGLGGGKFGPSGKVTVEQIAKVADKVAGIEEVKDAEVAGASEWAKGYVAAAVKAGLISEMDSYKNNASREQLVNVAYGLFEAAQNAVTVKEAKVIDSKNVEVTFSDDKTEKVALDTALEVGKETTIKVTHEGKEYSVKVTFQQAAAEASAVGAKKVQVKFTQAVDTSKVTFTVKKGTMALNVSAKTFADDKMSATLELSSKLTAGDYTVTVGGISDADLTSTFTAQDEKVTKVEFTSENAPLVELDADGADDLVIPYKVTNQYGEDVTKVTSLTTNAGTLNAAKGQLEITGSYKVGDLVPVSLVHVGTAVNAVKTFTVAAAAKVKEVAFNGVYNKDSKTLTEDTNLASDKFYLLVEAKDQYGNVVTDTDQLTADLLVNQTNNAVVDLVGGFTTVAVNGVDKTAILLKVKDGATTLTPGTNNVTLISTNYGNNASQAVVVAEATRAKTVNLMDPSMVIANEDLYVPVEVLDKDGNAITNVKTLNDDAKGVKVTFNSTTLVAPFVMKDGAVQIKVPAANIGTAAGYATLIAQPITAAYSGGLQSKQLQIKDAAVPTIIRGVDGDFSKTLKASSTVTLGVSNLAIEDQYGRVMSDASAQAALNGTDKYKLVVSDDSSSSVITLGGTEITGTGTINLAGGTANGTENITLTLNKKNGASWDVISSSAADVTLRVTDGSEYTSYTADAVGTVYDELGAGTGHLNNAAYDKAIKVYGVLNDGSKVQLTNGTDYSVTAASNATVNADVADSTVNATVALSYDDKTEVVVPITVTINKTGEALKQDVTFSKVAPSISAIKFVSDNSTGGGEITTLNVTAGSTFSIATLTQAATGAKTNIVATDQYGQAVLATAGTGGVTFADTSSAAAPNVTVVTKTGSVTIANNGLSTVTVTGIDVDDQFDVIVTYPGGATKTITVTGV